MYLFLLSILSVRIRYFNLYMSVSFFSLFKLTKHKSEFYVKSRIIEIMWCVRIFFLKMYMVCMYNLKFDIPVLNQIAS
jgi:hypothetical protein